MPRKAAPRVSRKERLEACGHTLDTVMDQLGWLRSCVRYLLNEQRMPIYTVLREVDERMDAIRTALDEFRDTLNRR